MVVSMREDVLRIVGRLREAGIDVEPRLPDISEAIRQGWLKGKTEDQIVDEVLVRLAT